MGAFLRLQILRASTGSTSYLVQKIPALVSQKAADVLGWQVDSLPFFFLRFYLFIFREKGGEGETEGEKHWCVRNTSIDCVSHAPNQGPGPQPRHVPWLGMKPATLWFPGWHSVHWATPASTDSLLLINSSTLGKSRPRNTRSRSSPWPWCATVQGTGSQKYSVMFWPSRVRFCQRNWHEPLSQSF